MPPLIVFFELLSEINKHPIILNIIKMQFYSIKSFFVKRL